MTGIHTLTDADWRSKIADGPALILLTDGHGVRGDFTTAFRKAAGEQSAVIFGQIDPTSNPDAKAFFGVADKPVMVGWFNGETLVRRVRPWGSDVVLAIEMLQKVQRDHAAANQPATETQDDQTNEEEKSMTNENAQVDNAPITVTDQTFQEAVVDYSNEMPVLVDFWAEWCGPCRMVAPTLEKLAGEYAGQVRIAKVNTDENPGLSQAFQIMSIPTFMIFKEGHLVFSQPGAFPEAVFRDLISQVLALDVQAAIAEQEAKAAEETNNE